MSEPAPAEPGRTEPAPAEPARTEPAGAEPAPTEPDESPAGGHPAQRSEGEPVLPNRSKDDSDEGWHDRPSADDDERLRREVPPHW